VALCLIYCELLFRVCVHSLRAVLRSRNRPSSLLYSLPGLCAAAYLYMPSLFLLTTIAAVAYLFVTSLLCASALRDWRQVRRLFRTGQHRRCLTCKALGFMTNSGP
jgi:hypothetical protein